LKTEKPLPPKLPLRFFRWFCHPELRDSIEGDLMELYAERRAKSGKKKADIKFITDVLLLFRPSIMRPWRTHSPINTLDMYKNYFLTGWRNMLRQRMYSIIKVGGFALGIAACLLIALFIHHDLSYDKHYPNANRIFRVVGVFNDNGEIKKDVYFQPPLAQALMDDFIDIEKAGRYNNVELFGAAQAEVRRAEETENLYEDGIVFFDQALIDIFQFPFVHGHPARALADPKTVVITQSKAEKYFPGENPIGKQLILNNHDKDPYTVSGVIEDFPSHSHLKFDFLITLSGHEFWKGEQTSWCCTNYPTYVMVKPGTDIAQLEAKMTKGVLEKYILPLLKEEGRTDAEEIVKKGHLELQPVTDIHLYSADIKDGLVHGDIKLIWLFGSVAVFILLIACINFINLSTAKSANRAKEVGLRKVVGSVRSHLIHQFLVESLLYSLISFIVGVALASLLLPSFNALANKTLVMPWQAVWFGPVILLASVIVGIIAGLYPSLYLSSFKPIQALKGNVSRGSKRPVLRNSLVVFQFTLSIILIAGTLIIYRQMNFILNTKLGFEKEQVVYLQGTQALGNQVSTFKEELLQLAGVQLVSVSDYLPVRGTKRNGNQFFVEGRKQLDKPVPGQFWRVDHDYIKTLGMRIVEGRDFDRNIASDTAAVIINQRMAQSLGLKEPVGSRIMNWQGYTVIGVVEDFHFESLKQNIEPLVLILGKYSTMISMKVNPNNLSQTIESVSGLWKKFAPGHPFRYAFLDQSYARMYDDVKRTGLIVTSSAIFAIVVACLGLFGLTAFMVEQRSREISIRLVLGASMENIVQLLTGNFIRLVLIAFVVAVPVAWYVMQQWLNDFAFRIRIGWDVFLVAGSLAVAIALFTVLYQAIRAALINPVDSLKSE
jgi:putative ABC transport system permease protein